jgi:hypothetical protein
MPRETVGCKGICRISSNMGVYPSERLVASREELQREFERHQDAVGEPIGYGSGIARWLASQLPGVDPRQLGWGILAVTAMLFPARDEDAPWPAARERGGERTSMMLASRVGEALVESAAPARRSAGAAAIGPELAACEMSAAYGEIAGLPFGSAATVDPAKMRREFHDSMADGLAEIRQLLRDELPGADLEAIGWALIGTGMSLLAQTSKLGRGTRRRGSPRTSAMRSSLLLAAVGDYLVGQSTQMDRSAR